VKSQLFCNSVVPFSQFNQVKSLRVEAELQIPECCGGFLPLGKQHDVIIKKPRKLCDYCAATLEPKICRGCCWPLRDCYYRL